MRPIIKDAKYYKNVKKSNKKAYMDGKKREWMKEWDKKNEKERPHELSAKAAVQKAVKDGVLIRLEYCECCGRTDLQIIAHHHNHEFEPLKVTWVCKSCHQIYHVGTNERAIKLIAEIDKLIKTKFDYPRNSVLGGVTCLMQKKLSKSLKKS